MLPSWDFLFGVLVAAFAAAGGSYVAIRADLARLHERSSMALSAANRAHDRIDKLSDAGIYGGQ